MLPDWITSCSVAGVVATTSLLPLCWTAVTAAASKPSRSSTLPGFSWENGPELLEKVYVDPSGETATRLLRTSAGLTTTVLGVNVTFAADEPLGSPTPMGGLVFSAGARRPREDSSGPVALWVALAWVALATEPPHIARRLKVQPMATSAVARRRLLTIGRPVMARPPPRVGLHR